MRPALGEGLGVPPEEVVVELLRRGVLEAEDLAPLGIDAGHHVLDRAILASGVHRLEDDQDRCLIGRVQPFLGLGERRHVLSERISSANRFRSSLGSSGSPAQPGS